jgi:hypothetical protein
MNEFGLGLDFLGAKPWSAAIIPGRRIERPKPFQAGLPTALLPLQRGERPPTGSVADEHRRGRALAWPPEAQVPPLGDAANGSGRIPLCAPFEMLCQGEKEWGKLAEQQVSWKPDGTTEVSLSAAKLIAQEVDAFAQSGQKTGLAVPDALGVGGQQAILSAVRVSNLVLIPRSIAAVIGYCRASEATLPRGHITVVDTSFGAWSIAKVPLDLREGPDGKDWNVPVSDNRLRRNKLGPTGWGILRKALRAPLPQTLTTGWATDILTGKTNLIASSTEAPLRLHEASYPWQSPLIGECSLMKSLEMLSNEDDDIACESPYKRNLGLMVIGPLAKTRFDASSLTQLIQLRLGLDLIETEESSVASGAAWAAAATVNDWPTWLEQMEELEIHYVGPDNLGNQANQWMEVIPSMLVDAGREYRNTESITGVKLRTGSDIVHMCLRRPNSAKEAAWLYREISSKPGKKHGDDVPLQINVCARPGQGFAEVTVSSISDGLFQSVLDWENMQETEQPPELPKGYIERAVELKAAPELWSNCRDDMMKLRKWLDDDEREDDIVEACRSLAKRLNKTLSSENYQKGYGRMVKPDQFALYTPMGRETCPTGPQASDAASLIERLKTAMRKWIRLNPQTNKGEKWIKKTAGWLYLGCPSEFIKEAISDITGHHVAVDEVHLHIAGLCIGSDTDCIDFFDSFTRKMHESSAPNNWMKALRNLIKLNEDSLKAADESLVEEMFAQSVDKLEWAYENRRPQITFNTLEALFFLLKFRRYHRSFMTNGSSLNKRVNDLCQRIQRETPKPRTEQLAEKFITFLNWEGNNDGLGDVLQGDDD